MSCKKVWAIIIHSLGCLVIALLFSLALWATPGDEGILWWIQNPLPWVLISVWLSGMYIIHEEM